MYTIRNTSKRTFVLSYLVRGLTNTVTIKSEEALVVNQKRLDKLQAIKMFKNLVDAGTFVVKEYFNEEIPKGAKSGKSGSKASGKNPEATKKPEKSKGKK